MHAPAVQLTLQGEHARLEPLAAHHLEGLRRSCSDEALWKYLPTHPLITPADWSDWLARALADREKGDAMPFAILDTRSGQVAGSTRFLDVSVQHRGLEIGWTFLGPNFQRTALNSEVKLLLLGHAFETLGAERVCIKTDGRNLRAQQAILRLGAQYEGTLRRHRILPDGFIRDSVYYSILADEWGTVRAALQEKLHRR